MPLFRRPELLAAPSLFSALRRGGGCAVVAAVVALCLPVACAQGPLDGTVYGVLRDAQDRGVAGAVIELEPTGANWGLLRSGRTFPDGSFLLPHLAPGEYKLRLPGVGASGAPVLQVSVGDTLQLIAHLDASGGLAVSVEEPVQHPGPQPLPDTDGDGLTSSGGLTAMQNGTLVDGASATQSYAAVPVGRGSNPDPDTDGDADANERTTGPANGLGRGRHAGVAYVFGQSSVREFRVTGQNYSAQTGRAGAVATTVSRSGTSELHGSGFYTVRSQALAAHDPLAFATSYQDGVVTTVNVKPHDLRTGLGGALGGPLPRLPNTVFFASVEAQLRGFPAVSSPADPNFYNLTAVQQDLLAARGVKAAAENAALNYLSSLTGLTPRRADETIGFGRLDWRAPATAARWWARGLATAAEYNGVRWHSPAGLIDAPVVARGRASLGNAAGSLDQAVVRLTHDYSATTMNSVRIGLLHDVQYETPQTPLAQEPAISPGGLAPEVNIAPNGLMFGTPASLSQLAYPDERRIELADTLTLVRGHHLIEVGGDVSFVHDAVATLQNAAGTFSYDSQYTGGFAGGLVDFITDSAFNVNVTPDGGCPKINAATHNFCFRSFSQSFGASLSAFSTQEWAGFAEDTWHPRRGLTLHAGARYEYTLLPLPQMPNAALDVLFGSRGATSLFPEDRNNLGPRASVAWEPFGAGHGEVRAGFGLFFGRLPGATIRSALSDTAAAGATTRVRIRPSTEVACPQAPAKGFGYPCAFASVPAGVVAATTSSIVFDRRFRLPVIEQGTLELERTFGHRVRLAATYALNLDRQLPGSTDLNILPATGAAEFQLQGGTGRPGVLNGETFFVPLYTQRVSPAFGPVTDIVSNVNASYNALTVKTQVQAERALRLVGEYTWSKAIDFGQNQSAIPRTNAQFDPFHNGYDKGLSSLDYPWAVRAEAVWAPRMHAGPIWVRRASDGWEVAPILLAHSGRPYSYDLSGGTYLPGGHESINGSGGALYLPTVGRNTLRLPATAKADVRAQRVFRAGQRMRVAASVEAFNVFNRRNVSSVTQRAFLVGTPVGGITPLVFQDAAAIASEGSNAQPFGTPIAAATSLARAREIQFGLRVQF